MKRKWHHPEAPKTGKRYWRSVGELEDTPEFRQWLEREFPAGAAEMASDSDADDSRRNFLKLMGAATSLAGFGMVGCRRPEKHILPYSKSVEWVIPGKSLLYATAMPRPGGATPLVVTTHEGRPTHLQGNPLHPGSGSGTDSFAISSILDLYDPDRVTGYLNEGVGVEGSEFSSFIGELLPQLTENKGAGVAVLIDSQVSPTRDRLLAQLQKRFSKLRLYRHDPLDSGQASAALDGAFGENAKVVPDLAKVDRLLTLDADFMGLDPVGANATADFMARRKADSKEAADSMNRLYSVENRYTVTGGAADHRLPLPASQVLRVAAMFARVITEITGQQLPGRLATRSLGEVPAVADWVRRAAEDLASAKGKALVLAGSSQPAAVHALVAAMNIALGAKGNTLQAIVGDVPVAAGSLSDLMRASKDGRVQNLFILGDTDPVYDTPADSEVVNRFAAIDNVVYLAPRANATAALADWTVPGSHYLESWSDTRTADGTYSIVQPMINPLYGGLSTVDMLLVLLGDKKLGEVAEDEAVTGSDEDPAMLAVKATFAAAAGDNAEAKWTNALRDGFLADSGYGAASGGKPSMTKLEALTDAAPVNDPPHDAAFEVVFPLDSKILDGRYINNGWQQECPDPITKLTWDNAALMSPRMFREVFGMEVNIGYEENNYPIVKISVNGRSIEVPVMEAPGHAHHSVTLPIGYGQEFGGRVGEGTGFNANLIRSTESSYIATGATIEPTGEFYALATTAEHSSMEGRALAREIPLAEQKEVLASADPASHPKNVAKQGMDSHVPDNLSLYKGQIGRKSEENPTGFDYEKEHQWGMTIDLSACIGCTSCLIACQSENNIPIVGKEQVKGNREMHWIRMDRYFASSDDVGSDPTLDELDNPEMMTQPVACVHCESAPCETVCPVNATVHTEEGINAMAYNRCIGTRYCANNCPYKARRFNFFDYNKRDVVATKKLPIIGEVGNLHLGPLGERADRDARKLQRNPNVTVRMRGVMEKCTYCVQRLESSKIDAKIAARGTSDVRVKTDSVRTACQDACPADAIVFGDLGDDASAVAAAKLSPRNYDLLNYIGTEPRTSYLARVKNPNPKMPNAAQVGRMTIDFH